MIIAAYLLIFFVIGWIAGKVTSKKTSLIISGIITLIAVCLLSVLTLIGHIDSPAYQLKLSDYKALILAGIVVFISFLGGNLFGLYIKNSQK